MGLEGQLYAVVRRREWGPGEKALFARRNDLRSIRDSLRVERRKPVPNPVLVGHLEDQHVAAIEALNAVEREHGFEPGHRLAVEDAIEADRVAFRERIAGIAPIRRSLETLDLAIETYRRQAENPERYPHAAEWLKNMEADRAEVAERLREALA